jgi:hypothetical protein
MLSPNKQLQRTVIRRRGRVACAPLHYARAPRFTRQRAAAELRRLAAIETATFFLDRGARLYIRCGLWMGMSGIPPKLQRT